MIAIILIERFEFHSLGRAACRDGSMAGAVHAAGFFCRDRRPTSTTIADGAADSSADDTVGVAAAISVLPVEVGKQLSRKRR